MNARAFRVFVACASAAVVGLAPGSARAVQDDLVLPLGRADALFTGTTGWLVGSAGEAELALYPHRGDGYHRWHGLLRSDIAIASPAPDSLVRLGLAAQTVADDRNDISFRLTRVYYDAFAAYERRLGLGVAYAGYRHRCSHGADSAVEGRILIRSGPELGYRVQHGFGALTLAGHVFAHVSLIAQNPDLRALPRATAGLLAELQLRTGWISWLLGAGIGAGLVGAATDEVATWGDPWRALELEPLPALAAGALLHGAELDLRVMLHYQRILDTGLGRAADPAHLVSLQVGFVY